MAWPVAALLFLQDEVDSGGFNCRAHAVGFVSDDAEDLLSRDECLCGRDDVHQKRLAADFVQDFGTFALEPRAFARGHDRYCETCRFHARYLLMPR